MIMLGTSLAGDQTSARPTPTVSSKISSFRLQNGEFDEFYVTTDTRDEFICDTLPSSWGYGTVLWCKFNGNLKSSNISDELMNADFLRIKRRKKNTYTWITLFEIYPDDDVNGWRFTRYDKTAQGDQDYDYAIVPVHAGIEGNLNITSVYSCFDGLFIFEGGQDGMYVVSHADYDNSVTRVKPTSQIETLGHRYPYTVSNGVLNYETGALSGLFAPILDNSMDVSFKNNSKYRDEVLKFMTNGKVKLLKQDNGRIWLIQTSDGNVNEDVISQSSIYDLYYVSFNWTEIADAQVGHDLYTYNFIECDVEDISIQ